MRRTRCTFHPTTRLLAVLLVAMCLSARAAELAASAVLSQTTVGVGEVVELQVKITGAQRVPSQPEISVEGLEVQYLGPSEQTQLRTAGGQFTMERFVAHQYQVSAAKPGTFTIPALRLEVDGRTLQTEPVTLTVQAGRGEESGQVGFAEIVVAKTSAYLGEAVPVEFRLYLDARVPARLESRPTFEGDGFTVQKMPQPREELARRDGREFRVSVFKTVITPSRAGKVTIGPSEVVYQAQIPRAQRRRRGSLFDMFGDDDMFGNGMFAATQRRKALAQQVELEVKALPAAGRPKEFSGAVGTFSLEATGSPNRVKVGDPITIKVKISGRGNFDRVEAPPLVEPGGWRTYPPASSFSPSDELAVSGAKTFEMAVIPQTEKSQMPAFAFAYFDPAAEKYVSLRSEAQTLVVEPGTAAPPVQTAPTPETDEPREEPPRAATDVLGLRYDAEGARRSFEPLEFTRAFWVAQLVPLAALFALLAARFRRTSSDAKRVAATRQERATLEARLQRAELTHTEFYETAAQLVRVQTALATGREATSIDAEAARKSAAMDDDLGERIAELFAARAELLYAGGGREDGRVPLEERERVLNTLRDFGRKHAAA